jgi:Tol biopolymer transport system component
VNARERRSEMNTNRAALTALAAALTVASVAAALPAAEVHPEQSFDAAWSPDGRRIAFVSNRDGNFEIYAVNADG